jgi:hypothetical protein
VAHTSNAGPGHPGRRRHADEKWRGSERTARPTSGPTVRRRRPARRSHDPRPRPRPRHRREASRPAGPSPG